ncbi:MAG TPA: 50S ribosomal protein L10 [Candidatus Saccharimonadales bacterium]|nr:50S ribosomal protein L10 [Candidatus Saccharimonadales bacterium]
MALTKVEKNQVVGDVAEMLGTSKLTVVAKYQGTSVQALQSLRRDARQNGTKIKVAKNRLVKKAIEQTDHLKSLDTSMLEGMLLYAFNSDDEVAPAKSLNDFAKTNPTLEFVGAFTVDGQFIGAEDVTSLAMLPSKEQLRGMLVSTVAAPLSGFVGVLSGNVRSVLTVLTARAEALEQ